MSKTSIKFQLNDADAVRELAKDPEVVIEIKKSILDGIAKRVAKCIEGDIAIAIKEAVSSFTHPKKANEIFDNPKYWSDAVLSDNMRDHVRAIVATKVRQEIEEVVEGFDANVQYVDAFNKRKKEIEQYDFDAAVQKFIASKLATSFGKLMMK